MDDPATWAVALLVIVGAAWLLNGKAKACCADCAKASAPAAAPATAAASGCSGGGYV